MPHSLQSGRCHTSMEEGSSTSPLGGSPAIDRYNPIIRDSRRNANPLPPCNAFQTPKIHHKRKNKNIPLKENDDQAKIKNRGNEEIARATKTDFVTPPSSTRYLLSSVVDSLSDFDLNLVISGPSKSDSLKRDEVFDVKPESPCFSSDQVVVLRVSLHCRGCERKMKKHISRMEGVTSYSIDFAAKKVTVVGKVTPVCVLSSISKVKNAQLWPPAISSPIPNALNFSNSEFKNGV